MLRRAARDCAELSYAGPERAKRRSTPLRKRGKHQQREDRAAKPATKRKGPSPWMQGKGPEAPAKGYGISDRQWLPSPAGEGEYPVGGLSGGSGASPDVACCSATRVVRRALRTACRLLQRRIALGDDPQHQRRSAEASRACTVLTNYPTFCQQMRGNPPQQPQHRQQCPPQQRLRHNPQRARGSAEPRHPQRPQQAATRPSRAVPRTGWRTHRWPLPGHRGRRRVHRSHRHARAWPHSPNDPGST